MKNKIVIIAEQNLNQRNFDRFGIDTLLKNGFIVEYWDVGRVMSKGLYSDTSQNIPYDGFRLFSTKREIKDAIKKLGSDDMIFNTIGFQATFLCVWFFRLLRGHDYIMACSGAVAEEKDLPPEESDLHKIQRLLRQANPQSKCTPN